uniref:Uncharacterized protein n=1 Tax=Panagrolaimus superbus TaxID=310955 RepID=A0A914XW05_9BILA
MYDKSNGTNLPNAPTWLDSKLIYSIYNGSCPEKFKKDDSVCSREISKKTCELFPEYTKATFDPNSNPENGTCSVVPRETLIAAWS